MLLRNLLSESSFRISTPRLNNLMNFLSCPCLFSRGLGEWVYHSYTSLPKRFLSNPSQFSVLCYPVIKIIPLRLIMLLSL